MLFLYWRKCHFLSYSYNRCLIKDPTEWLKIVAYFENSQTFPRGPSDSPEGWVHHKISLAIFGLVLGAIWNQTNWPGQQGVPGNGKKSTKNLRQWHFWNWPLGLVLVPLEGWAQHLSVSQCWVQWWVVFEAKSVGQGHRRRLKKDKKWRQNDQNWPVLFLWRLINRSRTACAYNNK